MRISDWSSDVCSSDLNSAAAPAQGEREVLYWYDPMVPDQRFEQPGKSPFMDMQLVPTSADEASSTGISIAPGVRQNLGIRTVAVEHGRLPGPISSPGTPRRSDEVRGGQECASYGQTRVAP